LCRPNAPRWSNQWSAPIGGIPRPAPDSGHSNRHFCQPECWIWNHCKLHKAATGASPKPTPSRAP
jgi:hypothetical protein